MILYDQNTPDSSIISYDSLDNKPLINGVMLEGNKTLSELGITSLSVFNQQNDLFRLDLNSLRGSKQDKLISGVNIKTVNGQDLLGNGNVSIEVPVTSVNGQIGDVVIDVPSLIPANYITYDKLYAEDYISKSVAKDIIRWEFDERSKNFVLKSDIDTSLSDISENPVQNKVVTKKIDTMEARLVNMIYDNDRDIDNLILKDSSHDASIIANTNSINYINNQRIPEITQLLLVDYINPIRQDVSTVKDNVSLLQTEIDTLKGDGQGSIGDLENRVQAIEDGALELDNYIKTGDANISVLAQAIQIQILTQDEYSNLTTRDASVLYIIKR